MRFYPNKLKVRDRTLFFGRQRDSKAVVTFFPMLMARGLVAVCSVQYTVEAAEKLHNPFWRHDIERPRLFCRADVRCGGS